MAQEEGPGPLAVGALLTQDHQWLLALPGQSPLLPSPLLHPSESSHPCSCILTQMQGCLSSPALCGWGQDVRSYLGLPKSWTRAACGHLRLLAHGRLLWCAHSLDPGCCEDHSIGEVDTLYN